MKIKKLVLLLFLIGMNGFAQIKGNKNIETRTFNIENIEKVKISLYAKVTIDMAAPEGMTIRMDSNLFNLIDKEMVDNTLYLDQKKWISPSEAVVITIGAPQLKQVETNTHDLTKIVNINNNQLGVMAPIGTIVLEGKTKELRLGAELANIDASKLIATNAFVNIWGWGLAKVNVQNSLDGKVSNAGRLVYVNSPKSMTVKTKKDGQVVSINNIESVKNPRAKYISFKIKNNSANRNQFAVVGPKPDGSKFGYGFPMMPFATKKERWTIGTKVYKVNKLGLKKLLVTINRDDQGKTVKLF